VEPESEMSEEKMKIDPRDARIVELLGELNGWKMRCSALERELAMTDSVAKPVPCPEEWDEDELEAVEDLNAADILEEARLIVTGARMSEYGKPERSLELIARFWNAYLYGIGYVGALEPHNIALMMALLKTARLCTSPRHRDSWVDGAGYFGIGAECALGEESK